MKIQEIPPKNLASFGENRTYAPDVKHINLYLRLNGQLRHGVPCLMGNVELVFFLVFPLYQALNSDYVILIRVEYLKI